MFEDVSAWLVELSILALPFLLAITTHELAHGLAAYALGDPTAKNAGRLTMNPIRHLDPVGTLLFFIARIGWAKPVPVDARYFKNPRQGMIWVSLAGPGANMALALAFALAFHALAPLAVENRTGVLGTLLVPLSLISQAGVFVNLLLCVFNLLPVPPLDGSNVVAGLLPPRLAYRYMAAGRYGVFIILALVVLGDLTGVSVLGAVLFPPVEYMSGLLRMPIFF